MNQFANIHERLESAVNQLFTAVARQQEQRSAHAKKSDALNGIAHLSAVYIKPVQERTAHLGNHFVGFSVVAVYGPLSQTVDVNETPLEDLRDARILARDIASQYSNLSEILCTPFIAVDKRITGVPRTNEKRPEVQLRIGQFPMIITCDNGNEAQSMKRALERGLDGQVGPLCRKSNLTHLPAAKLGFDYI